METTVRTGLKNLKPVTMAEIKISQEFYLEDSEYPLICHKRIASPKDTIIMVRNLITMDFYPLQANQIVYILPILLPIHKK